MVLLSDMALPKDLDRVSVRVTQGGRTLLQKESDVGPQALKLPAAFDVKATADSSPVTVRALGFKSGEARVERDAVTPIPDGYVGELRLALDYLCVGLVESAKDGSIVSSCAAGQTCVNGACESAIVPPSDVSRTNPDARADAGADAGAAKEGCFDVMACFAAATAANVDTSRCVITLADGTNPSTVNVALKLPAGGAGICDPIACYVALTGWKLDGNEVDLPPAACKQASSQGGQIVVSTACDTAQESTPVCGDWSSVTTPVSEPTTMSSIAPSCNGSSTQACDRCGTQARTCINGVYGSWGICTGEGACQPGTTQSCAGGGSQTCSDACQWGACGCRAEQLACGSPATCVSPSDVHTCGTCTNDCTSLPGVLAKAIGCKGGECTYECAAGRADCAGGDKGCTSDFSKPATCGSCSNDCTHLPHVSGDVGCDAGTCTLSASSCAAGWGDCNGDPSDGCEAALDTPDCCGSCTTACPGSAAICDASASPARCATTCSETLCGSSCVDTSNDASNCGACGSKCASGSCTGGKCTCTGDASQPCGHCGTMNRTCNTDGSWSSWSSCSEPAGACAAATTQSCGQNKSQTCSASCAWGACACSPKFSLCGSTCVDEQTDGKNCGACGNACASGVTCQNGACSCSGAATASCGNCGTETRTCNRDGTWSAWSACTAQGCTPQTTRTCDGTGTSTCSSDCTWSACTCPSGSTLCATTCVDEQNDRLNCGACGKVCGAGLVCSSGKCVTGLTATSIACGSNFACALLAGGAVECWGDNGSDELGIGFYPYQSGPNVCPVSQYCSTKPLSALSSSDATALAAGVNFVCTVGDSSECWGGAVANDADTPTPLSGIGQPVSISGGDDFACAVYSDGAVGCWGDSEFGALGNGSTTSTTFVSAPGVGVAGLSTATAVAVGAYYACALLSDGTVKCWGMNSQGTLGNGSNTGPETCTAYGSTGPCSTVPVLVSGLTNVTAIAAGSSSVCALLASGTVKCWGDNTYGELGDGTMMNRYQPVAVNGLRGVTAISVGQGFACALLSNGTVQCWGLNIPVNAGRSPTPVAVAGLTGVTAISAGSGFACALTSGGVVQCWGSNSSGQLGDGTTDDSQSPVAVTP